MYREWKNKINGCILVALFSFCCCLWLILDFTILQYSDSERYNELEPYCCIEFGKLIQ